MKHVAGNVTSPLRINLPPTMSPFQASVQSDSKNSQLNDAFHYVRKITDFRPAIALVLGSGLGSFANRVSVQHTIDSADIPNFPLSSVQGHAGKVLFGTIQDSGKTSLPLLLFQGRVHYYESGQIDRVVFSIELAHKLGARKLIVTNAAGGINANFQAGQLMLIKDTLNLARKYPLTQSEFAKSKHISAGFDPQLQELIRKSARDLKISLQEGTYGWLHGPSYETAAEIRMLRTMGVDAVGMSTVPEIIKATSLGMKVAGISLISNMATGLSPTKLSHEEVTETADKTQLSFSALMKEIILRIQ
jgi:purine-nucleoside phosphorylase